MGKESKWNQIRVACGRWEEQREGDPVGGVWVMDRWGYSRK